jgi:hypothetical protein
MPVPERSSTRPTSTDRLFSSWWIAAAIVVLPRQDAPVNARNCVPCIRRSTISVSSSRCALARKRRSGPVGSETASWLDWNDKSPSFHHSLYWRTDARKGISTHRDGGVDATARDDYSRASGPSSGTRRGLTRALRIGPVSSHAAPTRPPHAPEQRMRRSTSPTVQPGRRSLPVPRSRRCAHRCTRDRGNRR